MKKFIIPLLFLLIYSELSFSQGCLPDGIVFQNQAQIDNFPSDYPECDTILGVLAVFGDDIYNLDSLRQIVYVQGRIHLSLCPNLYSVKGFANIVNCGDSFIIEACPSLSDLSGLDQLTTIGNDFMLIGNDSITDLSPLLNLSYVTRNFVIHLMDGLKNLDGFTNLKKIDHDLVVWNNDSILDISSLINLDTVAHDIFISTCPNLRSLNGLNNINLLDGSFIISYNDGLTDIRALQSINAFALDSIVIYHNPLLSDCSIQSVCKALEINPDIVNIHDNAIACNTIEQVQESCKYGSGALYTFPLFIHEPQWSVLEMETTLIETIKTDKFKYISDTVLCDSYYSIARFDQIDIFIRQESLKTWYRFDAACSDKEYLLYDFTLSIGDTTYVGWNQYDNIEKDTAAFKVAQVDEVEQFGQIRQRLALDYIDEDGTYSGQLHWIEGIGCEEHPFYPFVKMDDDLLHKYELLCLDSANIQLYQNPNWNTCDTNYTTINELQSSGLSVSPNPFRNQLNVTSQKEMIKEIQLYSLTGQLIPITCNIQHRTAQVTISEELPEGVYIIKIISPNTQKNIKLLRLSDFPY